MRPNCHITLQAIVPNLIICQRAFGRCFQQVDTTQPRDRRGTLSTPSTPVLDSIYSLAVTPPSGQAAGDDHSTHLDATPSHSEGHDNELV